MMTKKEDTYSYKGWLVSDFIAKRAFAVMGTLHACGSYSVGLYGRTSASAVLGSNAAA